MSNTWYDYFEQAEELAKDTAKWCMEHNQYYRDSPFYDHFLALRTRMEMDRLGGSLGRVGCFYWAVFNETCIEILRQKTLMQELKGG